MRGIAIASGEENDHVDAEHDPQRPDPGFDGPEGKPQRQSHQAGRAERGQASRVDLRRLGPGHDDRGPGRSVARRIVMGELVDTDDAAEAVGCRGEAGAVDYRPAATTLSMTITLPGRESRNPHRKSSALLALSADLRWCGS
jgi:hypothetical protein